MNVQRVRAFGVTVALILGAGTVSAVAAPLLRTDVDLAAEPSEPASELSSEAPSEEAPDTATEDPSDVEEPKTQDPADDDAKTQKEREEATERRAERKADQAKRKAANAHANGNGNAHGKAVSAAARGETEPVGDCRNHGHWVSTVAQGLESCDDNPRPAGEDETD